MHSALKWTYAGDGVYMAFDGYYIWLKIERDSQTQEITLEPEILRAIVNYDRVKVEEGGFHVTYACGTRNGDFGKDGHSYDIWGGPSLSLRSMLNMSPPVYRSRAMTQETHFILEFDQKARSKPIYQWHDASGWQPIASPTEPS